jgi:hypothetical protein
MKTWTETPRSTELCKLESWKEGNPHLFTSEVIVALPPTPRQPRFLFVTPPNGINNLTIPVLDLAYASIPGLAFQPFNPTLNTSRQALSVVFLAVLLVRQLDEIDIYT